MTFLNPLLLIGALGVALPILAHLINQQQVQRTDWAAMQFLNRSVRVRSRQLRLRDLLLLLMRCLALLLIVFALARPATDIASGFYLPGEQRAGAIIAIDSSFSMAHSDGNATRFDRARDQVDTIAQFLKPGDPVSLVTLGGEHRAVLRNVAYDPDRFAQALAKQQPSPEVLDIDSMPRFLEALANDMDAAEKEIYIISDAQHTDWTRAPTALQSALQSLGQSAAVFLVPITSGDDNLAVTGLDLVAGQLRKGTVARYRATVHNFGTAPASNVEVRCRVEGVQIDSKRIPVIPPGKSESVSLFVPFYNAGHIRLTAEIDDEALAADNVRRAVAVVRDRVTVLCVDGSTGGAGRLMLAGLTARPDGRTDEDYVVRTVRWPALPTHELDQVDVIVLADVPEITEQQADALSMFVRQGNGLVWFAGEHVKIDQWNKLAAEGDNALLAGVLGPRVDARDEFGVGRPMDPSVPDHTVCRPLQALPPDLLGETRFLKRLQLQPAESSAPVLYLAGSQSPILLEHSLGRGHVFTFTTSAHTTWNNMALTPVFPMLMQQIVAYLTGREFEQPRTVGEALTLAYTEQPDATDAVFETPSQQTITVPVREHQHHHMALLEQSHEAGFYVARVSVQSPPIPIAVNVDTAESHVTCLSLADLTDTVDGTGITIAPSQAELSAGIQQARTGRTSWRYLMIAGLVMLLAEGLFADRTLRRRQSKRVAATASQRLEAA